MLKTQPYALDLRCHNIVGSYNHECGADAKWLGFSRHGFRSMFCQSCKDKVGNQIPQWVRADIQTTKVAALKEALAVLREAIAHGDEYPDAEFRVSQLYNVDCYHLRAMYDGDITADGQPAGRALEFQWSLS